jgi:hypothetical protein
MQFACIIVSMKKIILAKSLCLILFLLLFAACASVLISQYSGTIGSFQVSIGLTDLNYSGTGSGDSYRLILKFFNGAGEHVTFTLAPSNPEGSSLAQMYGQTIYNLDGSNNKFEGSALLGGTLTDINASAGQVKISMISIQGSTLLATAGEYNIQVEGGGNISGTFKWQASQ